MTFSILYWLYLGCNPDSVPSVRGIPSRTKYNTIQSGAVVRDPHKMNKIMSHPRKERPDSKGNPPKLVRRWRRLGWNPLGGKGGKGFKEASLHCCEMMIYGTMSLWIDVMSNCHLTLDTNNRYATWLLRKDSLERRARRDERGGWVKIPENWMKVGPPIKRSKRTLAD